MEDPIWDTESEEEYEVRRRGNVYPSSYLKFREEYDNPSPYFHRYGHYPRGRGGSDRTRTYLFHALRVAKGLIGPITKWPRFVTKAFNKAYKTKSELYVVLFFLAVNDVPISHWPELVFFFDKDTIPQWMLGVFNKFLRDYRKADRPDYIRHARSWHVQSGSMRTIKSGWIESF